MKLRAVKLRSIIKTILTSVIASIFLCSQVLAGTTQNVSQQEDDTQAISQADESSIQEITVAEESESEDMQTSDETETTETTSEAAELKGYNFVIFCLSGTDTTVDQNRSDTIMICTVDSENKEIKLTSILRDTKATIEGHEAQKINAAYKYGGAELALQTIYDNFNIDIDSYVTISFDTVEDIVDLVDGVEIELSEDEAALINKSCPDENVTEGVNTLTGEQAVAYCRIRIIDSDKIRAGRSQAVLEQIFSRMKSASFFTWISLIYQILTTVEINIPFGQLLSIVTVPLSEYTIVKNVVPDIEYETDLTTAIDEHGEWVWLYDTQKAGERIVEIINNP